MVFSIIEGVQVVVANITHLRRLLRLLALLPFTKISKLGCAFCSYLAIITVTSYSLRRIEKMRQKPHFVIHGGVIMKMKFRIPALILSVIIPFTSDACKLLTNKDKYQITETVPEAPVIEVMQATQTTLPSRVLNI